MITRGTWVVGLVSVVAAASIAGAQTPANAPTFSKDIAPIFAEHCLECHGPEKSKGGLNFSIEVVHVVFLSICLRRVSRSEKSRDFTVPEGISSTSAISATLRSRS